MILGGPAQSEANFTSGRSHPLACNVCCERQDRVFKRTWHGLLLFSCSCSSLSHLRFSLGCLLVLRSCGRAADQGPNLSVSQNATAGRNEAHAEAKKAASGENKIRYRWPQKATRVQNVKRHCFCKCFRSRISRHHWFCNGFLSFIKNMSCLF